MTEISFVVEDGKVVCKELLWDSVKRFFKTIKTDGRWVWAMPEKEKKTRSIQQNRYMFGVVYKYISDFTGYETSTWRDDISWVVGLDKDEVHSEMGKMFLTYEKNGREYVLSTKKLSTTEMEKYLENVRMWAAKELQLYIPLPRESEFPYDIK